MFLWFKKKCSFKSSSSSCPPPLLSTFAGGQLPRERSKASSHRPCSSSMCKHLPPHALYYPEPTILPPFSSSSSSSFPPLNSPPSSPPPTYFTHGGPPSYVEPFDLPSQPITAPLNIHASYASEKTMFVEEPITPISSKAPSSSHGSVSSGSAGTTPTSSPPLQGDMTYQSFYALFASPPSPPSSSSSSSSSLSSSLHPPSITDLADEYICPLSLVASSPAASPLFFPSSFTETHEFDDADDNDDDDNDMEEEDLVPPLLSRSFDGVTLLPPSPPSSSPPPPKKSISFHPVCPLIAFTAPDYDRSSNPDDFFQRLLHRRISNDEIVQVRQELLLLKRSSCYPPTYSE